MSDLDAAADDLIADLLGGGGSEAIAPPPQLQPPPQHHSQQQQQQQNQTTSQLQSVIRGDTRRATLSEQLGWLREGLPRSLWKPLTSRAAGVLNGEVALLRPYFEDQALVTSTRCSCTQCDELFAAPVKLPCGDTFCAECVEDTAQCPLCSAALQLDDDGRVRDARPISLVTLLNGALLSCPLGDCEWRGTLDLLPPHVDSACEYRPMQCQFVKCRAMLVRCQLHMHEKLCANRALGTKEDKRRQHAAERAALKAATGSDLPPWGGVVDADTTNDSLPHVDVPVAPAPAAAVAAAPLSPPAPLLPNRAAPLPPPQRALPGIALSPTHSPTQTPARAQSPPQRTPIPPGAAARTPPQRSPIRRMPGAPPKPSVMPRGGMTATPPPTPAQQQQQQHDEDSAPVAVELPDNVRELAPAAPPRPIRQKRSTVMLESAPLVLEQAPALTESMPAAHAMQRLSVLAGNIGALQMKLKERALASDERAMYANELDRALDDQVATQRHVERVAPDLFAPTGADEQQHLAVVGGPPPLAARRPSPLDGGPARRPPAGRPIGGNASPMLPPSTPMREAPPPPPSTASNNNSPTNGLPPPRSSAHDAPALRVEIPSGDEASRVVFSKPTDVRRNPEAVQALLAAAGLDSSVLDRQSSASLPLSPPLSPRRNDISRPTDVKRNPEAVKALLAGAGIDASVLERADSRQSRTDGASSPVNVGGAADVRLGVGSPMDVRRNPEAVRALLAQAGVDPSSVLKAPPGATNSPVPPLQLPPTVVSDDGATDRYSPKSAALHPALHPVSPQRSPRNEAIVEAKMQEIMALQEATMLAKQQAALAAAQRRPSADVDDGAGGAAGGAPRPRPEAQLSPRSQQQKRLWATHKESATKASLGDYATLYRDTGADVGGDDEDGPPPGPPPSAPAQADKRPPPPRGAPPPSSGGEPRTRLRSFSDAGGDTPPPPLGGVGAAAPFSQHHIPASSVPTTPRGSAVANVFVDLDAPLPGNEMIVSVQVAWNAFTTKVRHQRDDPLLSMRDHIVSLLVSRGQLPAHGDAAVERYQLFRGEGTRRGGKLDLRRSLVANDLAHMSVITIDDIGFVPPPPDEELRRGSSDKRMEKPRTPRSAAAAAASTAGVGGAPAVVVGGASSSAQPPPPPPPPPDGDEESWSDDEGEEYTYEDAPRRSGSDRERRQGGGGSSISAARRTSPLPPAVDALLVLARKKLHAEVERLLPTLTADERHLFKSEIRKRRDAKHRRREGGSSSSKRR